jgi:hypothetical protein
LPRKEAAGALGKAVRIGRSVKIAWAELHRFAAERPAFKRGKAA